MGENNFKGTVESLFKGMEGFITSKTVVGDWEQVHFQKQTRKIMVQAVWGEESSQVRSL